MIIKELYNEFNLTSLVEYSYVDRDGQEIKKEDEVLSEHLIEVYVNEILTMKLVCIPQYLTELVLGRLLTEGIISSVEDVESVFIGENGMSANVLLTDSSKAEKSDFVETTQSCCTSNHILNDYFHKKGEVQPVNPIEWKEEWIFKLADKFAAGMPIHEKTFSTHSAFLALGDELLFECEDIGRHNAIDKAIGYALRNGINLSKCILYSSGRIPTDMVMKAIRAKIPILASKAALTSEAVVLAEKYNLTLICAARRDRMKVYTNSVVELK